MITEGPFRLSRNPIYLAMSLLLLGAVIARGQPACLSLVPAYMWLVLRRFIQPEEAALLARFGADAQAYIARTHRWI